MITPPDPSGSRIRGVVRRASRAVFGPQLGEALVNWPRDRAYALAYRVNPRGRRSARQLRSLRNRFQGERCFIIGNGPSLRGMDLAPLANEHTFGLNRGYLLFDRIGGPTSFLVSINQHVIEQFGGEMARACEHTFFSWQSRHSLPADVDATLLLLCSGPQFSDRVDSLGVWDGGTVTFVALQLAYYFGFAEVVLIGVDHAFNSVGDARALITSTGADPNHFDPSYFGPGIRWQLPDLETSEVGYLLAKHQFQRDGRRILDATVEGKLTIFRKVNYQDVVSPRGR